MSPEDSHIDAEQELRRVNLIFNSMLTSVDTSLVLLDESETITTHNPVAERHLGISGTIDGVSFRRLTGAPYLPAISAGIDRSRAARAPIYLPDIRWRNRNGAYRVLSYRIVPMFGPDERSMGFLITGSDVTDAREATRQGEEGQKFRAIGELAAGIAHEINTPVQFVRNNLVYLQETTESLLAILDKCIRGDSSGGISISAEEVRTSLGEFPDAVTQSLEGIDRIASIIRSLRDYSHPGTAEPQRFDLVKVIRDAATLSSNAWKRCAALAVNADEDPLYLNGIPEQITQTIVNLIVNAAHAVEERHGESSHGIGAIEIACRRDGRDVELRVTDNGIGMSDAIRERIFEPFFTTKPIGKGTGQGLAQVYSCIVTTHGGTIHVDSVPDDGSTFTLRLPAEES